jgi:glycosyltransferase involved in cell wall biosynthesis
VRGLLGWLRGPRNFTWRHSAGCVVLGRDMAELASRQRIPPGQVTIISNWAPQGLAPPPAAEVLALREKWHLAGKFVVAYSGNLGRVHDLEPVLAVAGVLRATPEIVFAFVGAGAQRETLEALVAARQLTNVRFFPPQPRDLLGATLAMGDVHLVTLRPGCEALVFPSKLYGIAAVGRPAVFIGPRDCELARMIEDQQIGFAFAPHETSAAADALRQLHDSPAMREQVGRAAAHFAASAGGSRAAVEKWHALLSRGAGPGATPTEPMGQPG